MGEGFDALYGEYRQFLVRVAMKKFAIPPDDAEAIVHDIFVCWCRSQGLIRDNRRWLIAAVCNASRHYHRRLRREMTVDVLEELANGAWASMEQQTVVNDLLSRLDERTRLILRLKYMEGYSTAEIAIRLATTYRYAEKLIGQALASARTCYGEKAGDRIPSG